MAKNGPVLVVGGTGLLGGQVVTELLTRGKPVRALVRPASNATNGSNRREPRSRAAT